VPTTAKIAVVPALKHILALLAVAGTAPGPDTFSGSITDSAGHPLSGAEVTIYGTTGAGQHASFELRTDASGRYSIHVPRGLYTARAYANVTWNGNQYRLSLHPADNENSRSYDSKPGVLKNFVWRLSGLKAFRNPDPERPESYYGGAIHIVLSDPMRMGVDAYVVFAPSTVIEVLLNPIGALLDGSTAHPLLFEVKASSYSPHQCFLRDIPAGRYLVTARARKAGTSIPLRVAASVHEGGTPAPPAKSVDIAFQPSNLLGPSSDGFETVTLYVMN
jgi:hypothetical protein